MRGLCETASRFILLGAFLGGPGIAFGQTAANIDNEPWLTISPHDRITQPINHSVRVPLTHESFPLASAIHETGTVERSRKLTRVLLLLKPALEQQQALDTLLQEQQDPASPFYHQWLTPQSYARHFGASPNDIATIKEWLESYGLTVDDVAVSGRTIAFSGTVAEVESAFRVQLRIYQFAGTVHVANDGAPSVPAALAAVVDSVVSLNDFFSQPQHTKVPARPDYTAGGSHYLAPGDFASIYGLTSLYGEAVAGSEEKIAVVGRANIHLDDVRSFRSQFGLRANDPVVIVNGNDPGSSVADDVDESTLDVEWSGAVANAATIEFVTSASTSVTDGVFLSAQYAVDHNIAPILSVSYGLCEAALGGGGNSFLNALWQQAAAQGITVVASSGDSGAAGCDSPTESQATLGRGINGVCSTPYSTCVGGTEFDDTTVSAMYWESGNSGAGSSALGYIPESGWNESNSGGLWATGGGSSLIYAKPSWQSAPGVPADGKRDVPDVALTAATHDGYLVEVNGGLYAFGGTSAAAPAFAGILALVAEESAARLGNPNRQLYKMASLKAFAGNSIFHDVTEGNNSVPGVLGYTAGAGYDLVTGLGSIDAQALVNAWTGQSGIPGDPVRVHGGPARRRERVLP